MILNTPIGCFASHKMSACFLKAKNDIARKDVTVKAREMIKKKIRS